MDSTDTEPIDDYREQTFPPKISEEQVNAYCDFLGLDRSIDDDLLWIAYEGLSAPLPKGWKFYVSTTDPTNFFFFNENTNESIYQHPLDRDFVELFKNQQARKNSGKQYYKSAYEYHNKIFEGNSKSEIILESSSDNSSDIIYNILAGERPGISCISDNHENALSAQTEELKLYFENEKKKIIEAHRKEIERIIRLVNNQNQNAKEQLKKQKYQIETNTIASIKPKKNILHCSKPFSLTVIDNHSDKNLEKNQSIEEETEIRPFSFEQFKEQSDDFSKTKNDSIAISFSSESSSNDDIISRKKFHSQPKIEKNYHSLEKSYENAKKGETNQSTYFQGVNNKEKIEIKESIKRTKTNIHGKFNKISSDFHDLRQFLSNETKFLDNISNELQNQQRDASCKMDQAFLDLKKAYQTSYEFEDSHYQHVPIYLTPTPKRIPIAFFEEEEYLTDSDDEKEKNFKQKTYKSSQHRKQFSSPEKHYSRSTKNRQLTPIAHRDKYEYQYNVHKTYHTEINNTRDTSEMIQQLKHNVKEIQERLHNDFVQKRIELDID